MAQKFLEKIIDELRKESPDLGRLTIVLPGKRPVVFIKEILKERQYTGFLPDFFTIEELVAEISQEQEIKGVALWLFAFDMYQKMYPSEELSNFLKWFPTILKDWDDMLKFAESDMAVLSYMFDEEWIKNWAENLADDETIPRRKFLNFWKKMYEFLPVLKNSLRRQGLATSGMIHEAAKENIENFARTTPRRFVFCGFNAFTPVEEKLVRNLLQWDKANCYFQADYYYIDDERQEAGKFLRAHRSWKEFNKTRDFKWIEDDFVNKKDIKIYEVAGNVTQTKVLPGIFKEIAAENLSKTAVILLDENLLPATLDALGSVERLNITMGFPLKNLSFSNAVKQLFYLQKQLEKRDSSYYYKDVLPILEELPNAADDARIVANFRSRIEERNIVYISKKNFEELLGELSYFQLLVKPKSAIHLLDLLIRFCFELKFQELDDIQYENVSHFEKSFKIIKNQISPYGFEITMETLEVLINQLVATETIDFQGEPLQGLQVMGLLETRLLNFENVIVLSVNEGKLPLGNSQNTYIPFDVRRHYHMHTFLENDSIYAYHFYRLLQDTKSVHLLYNALSSGVNTGEKSRFITQMEMESSHDMKHIIVENSSEPISDKPITIQKTPSVLQQLELWKSRVSASHLTTYLYNPIDFYLTKILQTKESNEIEEELSVRSYGNLIHYTLQEIYEKIKGRILNEKDLEKPLKALDDYIGIAIEKLKHQPEFYEKGMNYIHKSIAKRVVGSILKYDLDLVRKGNSLEILDLERKFEDVVFFLDDEKTDKVCFYGFIDRIDKLNGTLRIIDYKTAKTKNLNLKIDEKNKDLYLRNNDKKQALQLCIYKYVLDNLPDFAGQPVETGIWSFAEVNRGVVPLDFEKGSLDEAMASIRGLIKEILDPAIPFVEEKKVIFTV